MSSRSGLIIRRRDGKGGYAGTRDMTSARRAANRTMQRSLLRGIAASSMQRSFIPARRIAGEVKGCDTAISYTNVVATTTTNANIILVNPVQQGAGSWNRVGKKIQMKSLRVKGTVSFRITPNAVTGNIAFPDLRMVVIYDKGVSQGAIPNFDTIFGYTDGAGTEASIVQAPLRYDNMERFIVLRDCVYDGNPGAIITGGTTNLVTQSINVDEYIKMKGLDTVFASTSNPITTGDITNGALYVVFRATAAIASEEATDFAGVARLRYYD